jgi:hypothetical protein
MLSALLGVAFEVGPEKFWWSNSNFILYASFSIVNGHQAGLSRIFYLFRTGHSPGDRELSQETLETG